MKTILLPGITHQIKFLFENLNTKLEQILVIGSGHENIALEIAKHYNTKVSLIVDDYESFIISRLELGNNPDINVVIMEYENTDFNNNQFDLIYAQASISLINRNKIIKEVKRILKPDRYFCAGELVSLKKDTPKFMKDIFDTSGLLPLFIDDLENYYTERNFKVINKIDLSDTLKDYYSIAVEKLKIAREKLDEKEKAYYKKLLNRFSHESNVYLKLGGNKYLGFFALILQKGKN